MNTLFHEYHVSTELFESFSLDGNWYILLLCNCSSLSLWMETGLDWQIRQIEYGKSQITLRKRQRRVSHQIKNSLK